MTSRFESELRDLINKHSLENASDTPDFVLAKYLLRCLEAFNEAMEARGAISRKLARMEAMIDRESRKGAVHVRGPNQ